VGRRVYLALRLGVAFVLWLWFAFMLSRIGLAAPTERIYSWQELRKWALNPSPLPDDQELNLGISLKYSLPVLTLLFSGVAARLLTRSLLLLAAWGTATWAASMLLSPHFHFELHL
jgi:hypothetical protein